MPDHIQDLIYPQSFLKDFSVVKSKPAVENNSLNNSANIFIFPDCLFNNYNRNYGAFLFSEGAQHTNVISFLTVIKTRSIASLQFEMVKNICLLIGKKKRKFISFREHTSSSASLSKRKEVILI